MLKVHPIPAFADNYLWAIHNERDCVVVDPGDAAPVLAYLSAQNLRLSAVLVTHHHADHVGGLPALREAVGEVPVYGPAFEDIAGVTHPLAEGDTVSLDAFDLSLSVIEVPGHTRGHIAYFADAQTDAPPRLFCGDTLFAAGCGRLFEGTPAQMWRSLGKLAALPSDTEVYCTHEYTLSNLRFARAAEPGNALLAEREHAAIATRAKGLPTLPSNIALERATNPFLRADQAALAASAKAFDAKVDATNAVEVFGALREWKNNFK